jgi:hypothetical protein
MSKGKGLHRVQFVVGTISLGCKWMKYFFKMINFIRLEYNFCVVLQVGKPQEKRVFKRFASIFKKDIFVLSDFHIPKCKPPFYKPKTYPKTMLLQR